MERKNRFRERTKRSSGKLVIARTPNDRAMIYQSSFTTVQDGQTWLLKKGAILSHRQMAMHLSAKRVLWCLGSFHTSRASTSRVASCAFQPANLPSRLKPKDSLDTRRLRQINEKLSKKVILSVRSINVFAFVPPVQKTLFSYLLCM